MILRTIVVDSWVCRAQEGWCQWANSSRASWESNNEIMNTHNDWNHWRGILRDITSNGKDIDATLSVQYLKRREVAKLRRDGPSELIRLEISKGATMRKQGHEVIDREIIWCWRIREIRYRVMANDAIPSVHSLDFVVAELWRNCASNLILVKTPERAIMNEWNPRD